MFPNRWQINSVEILLELTKSTPNMEVHNMGQGKRHNGEFAMLFQVLQLPNEFSKSLYLIKLIVINNSYYLFAVNPSDLDLFWGSTSVNELILF